MPKSLREITTEQFSNGTTADGNRIERALEDFFGKFNSIPQRNIPRRWVPQRIVGGWLPCDPNRNVQGPMPFMSIQNLQQDTLDQLTPVGGFQNVLRFKGTQTPGINLNDGSLTDSQWAWSQAFCLNRPVILTGFTVSIQTDKLSEAKATYINTLAYGVSPPPTKTTGEWVNDVSVEVSSDSLFLAEQRNLDSIDAHRGQFSFRTEVFSPVSTVNPAHEMLPPHPCNTLKGAVIQSDRLYIPLRENDRFRFSLILPQYDPGYESGWNVVGAQPWQNSSFSYTLTLLEGIEGDR